MVAEFERVQNEGPLSGSTDDALKLAAAPTGTATDAAPGDAPPSASGGATTGESTPTTQGPTKVPPEATAFQAGWTLYQSIQGGDGLGIATAGVNAVNIANWYQGDKLLPKDVAPGFRTVGAGLGLASAGVGLYNSIDSGDPLGIAYSTASLAQQATQLWTGSVNSTMLALDAAGDFAGAAALYSQSASLGAVASVLGDVVPILGAALALSQGNYIGAVASILMMIPATFVIGLVLTIVSALFSGDDEPEYDWIPAAGNGSYTRGEDGAIGIEATGTNRHKSIEETPVGPGTEGASVVAGKLAAALSSLLLEVKGSQNDEDGPAALALIPERLPNLHFLGHNAFVIEFTDPHTGETRQVGANIVDVERLLVEVAHHAEALAPAWEAEQVEAKLTAGDPNAAETEAQYAHRLNPDASTDPADHAGRQTLPALVVDLAGDGITTTKLPEETGRTLADLLAGPLRYDVDSDGFLEAVEWPGLRDALLTLDRDGDGRIGNARELLASPNLPEPMRGSEMLAWLDANRDGFLDHRDPGFAALALWLDVNADAQSDPGEVLSLAQIGANALVLGPAGEADATIHLEDGASLAVEEVALDAETDGVRMAVLPGGVLVEAENGLDGQGTDARLLYVSGVADLSDPETARIWGVDPALETSRGIDTTDADASLDEAHGARASREARRIVLGGAEQGLLFAGAAGAIAALGLGVSGTAAAEELRAGRIEFVLPDGTLAPLAAPIVITEAVGRPREAGAEPPPPAHPPIVARASDVVSFPLASATTDSEPMPARSVGASPPIVVTADAITPVSSPAPTLAELTSLAELPAGGMDPFAQNVPTLFSELTGLEDDPIVLDGAELLERAGFDGDPAAVISWAGEAQHGQVVLGADGLVRFVPEANFHGTASFTYMLGGLFGRAEIVLEGVNDAPVPIGDLVAGEEDRELLFTAGALAANDRDPDIATDGDSLRVTAVGAPEHGSVELLPDGTVRFIPDADFWGEARFAYTVDDDAGASATGTAFVQLASVNDAPVAIGELIGAGVEDTALLVDPLLLTANDTDIDTPTDGDVLTVSAVFDAEHGQVALLVDGTVQFTPDANFHGLAAFGYSVSDGRGGLAQAQALVTVAGVNDAPIGVDEMVAGAEDTPLVIVPAALLANEVDPDIATDGQLLKITAVGEAEHGAVGLAPDGTVVFVPETDYWGEGAFSYTVSDGAGGFASARATVTLASVEDPPIAGADGFAGVEDATLLLDPQLLIANDRDPDGDAVHFVGVAGATHGAVSLQADGQVRFMPAPDFFGLASFDYLVADTKGNTSQGTAFVQLENVNDAPRVEAIEFGRALYAYEQITGYDSEFNYSSSIQPIYDHARALALYAAGEARNSSGTPIGASYYQSGALRPIALITEEQQYSDSEGGSYSYDDPMLSEGRVIAYDPDGDPVTFSVAAHPVHGSVAVGAGWSFNEANTWRYQSTYGDGYSGADPFVVRVTDPSGESTTFTVNTSHYGTIAGGGGDDGCCPVMVDLDADGVELVDVDDSRLLRDLDGDGWMERLGWAAEDDALLAYDADDDGFITRAEEISFVAYTPGARTDLEGLAAFDTDGDGKLTAADAEWERFHLWQDRGADGRSDPGELTPLAETGIVAISLASDGRSETRGANVIFGRSSYERADGSTGEVGDVMFAIRETGIPAGPAPPPTQNAAAEALEAHFARLALQLVSEMAAFDPKAPAELDVPPSAPPADATLAENPLQRHEQA
ncbi:MAG TPA: cadherin-like domain-containing protein [Burkholderiales bacterium]|nr:cadherin-like domain-containing protein [Burkholderiales bacterium]